ncbi:MAG: helix-turn-helix domain-containing protein [Sedimenticola sp.]
MLIHSPKDLATYYRDQRKARGLSQTAVAEETVVRQDTVSKFETRPNNVRLDTLFRLISALDLELHLIPKGQSVEEGSDEGWSEPW